MLPYLWKCIAFWFAATAFMVALWWFYVWVVRGYDVDNAQGYCERGFVIEHKLRNAVITILVRRVYFCFRVNQLLGK